VTETHKKGNDILFVSVLTPKTAVSVITPNVANKSDASHIQDAVKEYVKILSLHFVGATKHTDAHKKKNELFLREFICICIIWESSCISEYLKENVTDPTDGLKNDPGLLGILGEAVMLAK
jgi:hypothetical protein